MSNYPEVVSKIAADYLQRVKSALRLIPAPEQDEFLREIESHLYEAYQQTPGDDDVERILSVLRNMGEPADLVADRLPRAMTQSGARRNLPLYIAGGIFLALFGLPLGAGGVAVLAGMLAALAGIVLAYYTTVGVILLVSVMLCVLGLSRIYAPGWWDRLVTLGIIQLDREASGFLDQLTGPEQGGLFLAVAAVFAACGIGGLWLGRYFVRGLRFLFTLAFDRLRQLAQTVRRKLSRVDSAAPGAARVSFVR